MADVLAASASIDFDLTIDEFCEYLAVQRRYSPNTIGNYRRDLCAIADALVELGVEDWRGANPFNMRTIISRQHGAGLSGRSLARRLSAVRSLYKYLIRQKRLEINPVIDVPAPKDQVGLPETLQIEEIQRLFAELGNDPITLRDRAVFELIYSSGLRLAEVVQLDLNSVNLANTQMRVTGKGNKTRELPVGRHAISALKQWLAVRPDFAREADEKALFLSRRGVRLSHRSVQQRLKQMALKTGLSRNVYPHLLRHSFASHMLESSGDLRAVQELLGHADISSTQVYTHLDFQHLAKVYERSHPRATKRDLPDTAAARSGDVEDE